MKFIQIFVLLASVVAFSSPAFSKGKEMKAPTKEQRAQMATNMENMAKCLRSDKDMKDCRKEMMDNCKAHPDQCPMMKKMHKHHMKMKNMKDDSGEEQVICDS